MKRNDIRNIAIIAHVDHGKTTLVDEMLKQGGIFRSNQQVDDRVMDNNALEKERGITILAKNTSANYKDVKINIIDTPGHADFSGEVERVLKMVNGVLLLVDAAEGPMPQTRFVLSKALALGHRVIIVINKIDKPDARVKEVCDEVLSLFMDLNASDFQLDSPFVFCSGRKGTSSRDPNVEGKDLSALFDLILDYIECPEGDEKGDLQLLVSAIDYNDFVGRIGIGRIERGAITLNQEVAVVNHHNKELFQRARIASLFQIEGLKRIPIEKAFVGDIVCFSGFENIFIGDTITCTSNPEAIPFVKIGEPTVEMTFTVNDSPLAGREGKFVTTRQIRERLFRELLKDVSLRVYETDSADAFRVCGRGEMHLSILIENMRREGFEFAVSTPKVLLKENLGVTLEPFDNLVVDVPQVSVGAVMEKMGLRKAELVTMHPMESRIRMEFIIPSRGLFGYRSEFLTDTKGEGILSSVFADYMPMKGEIIKRSLGSLVAFEDGESVTYGLYNAQERGTLFIGAGVKVYEGMVVGISPKAGDLNINVCKKKHITNTRSSSADEALRLIPPKNMSLEESLEFLNDDEILEVTPQNLRIRKRVLDSSLRAKAVSRTKNI
ncbi:MAG: translational GTPase TypA [Clostridia bacterium]